MQRVGNAAVLCRVQEEDHLETAHAKIKSNLHYRKSKMGSFLRILMKLPLPRAVGDLATDSPEGIAEQLRFRIVYPCLQIDFQNRILH